MQAVLVFGNVRRNGCGTVALEDTAGLAATRDAADFPLHATVVIAVDEEVMVLVFDRIDRGRVVTDSPCVAVTQSRAQFGKRVTTCGLAYVRGPRWSLARRLPHVMSLDADGQVVELTTFVLPELVAAWGFPPVLDA